MFVPLLSFLSNADVNALKAILRSKSEELVKSSLV